MSTRTNNTAAMTLGASQAPSNFIHPNFDRMPPELKRLNNWVLWVPIWTGSKWTKRPFQVSGFGASTTNPKHWSSFDDVKEAYERAAERGYIEIRDKGKSQTIPIGGVGFVFDGQPDAQGLVFAGVDFDQAISVEGKVASAAAERIKRLGSYVEVSVSKRGLHVIVMARRLRAGISHGGVELYTHGRFFTMTGRSTGGTTYPVVNAERAFAALAEELQAQSRSSSSIGNSLTTAPVGKNELGAGIETGGWFDRLPAEKRSEVIRHAVLHIAKNSKLFELGKHGGNNEEYLQLAFAIARSGVPDAEDIFVEAAAMAKDADPEEELRSFFQGCNAADPHVPPVTVGTLFYNASRCGADFSEWKRVADECDPDVALFVPGNEEKCRKLLDREVADDPCTYTLGDPSGPLTILRVPDGEAFPSETRWEGDLPGTTLAAAADVMERAERITWMREDKCGRCRIRPPRGFITDYLTQMRGRYKARPLRGIVRVPRIDDNGDIDFVSGYDPQTGLFHDRSPKFHVPPTPSLKDARRAAIKLLRPFSKYKFENRKAGRALLLAAVFTAIERAFLPVAPMFVVRSSMPGTGKGLIVRGLVRLAFDTAPVFITWGGSGEEFEKRLAALLLQTPGVLSIDNANGMQIKGDLLESIITEGSADVRPLGHSKIVKLRNRSLITLTGNNPIITGDMARRALPIDILPRSADPERDRYDFNPVEVIQRHRADFLQAAFTAMRAFRLARMPSQGLPAVGSFDDWSRKVRDLVYWLTGYEVSEAFRQNKAEDPWRQGDASLLAALHQHFGTSPFKAADAIAAHDRVADYDARWGHPKPTATEQALHEALEDVLGSKKVDAKFFGYWARRVKGAHLGGYLLDTLHDAATNANVITVRQT